jgi:hypothetical protein
MPDTEFRIFLSAVSSEFRSARNALTDDFGARNAERVNDYDTARVEV